MDKTIVNLSSANPRPLSKDSFALALSPQQELHDALAAALQALYGDTAVILSGCDTLGAPGWIYSHGEIWRVPQAADPASIDPLSAALVADTQTVSHAGEPVLQQRRMEWTNSYNPFAPAAEHYHSLRRASDLSLACGPDAPHRPENLHLQYLEANGVSYGVNPFDTDPSAPLRLTRTAGTVRITGRLTYAPKVQLTTRDIQMGYVHSSQPPFIEINTDDQLAKVRNGEACSILSGQVDEVRYLAHFDGLFIEINGQFSPHRGIAASIWSNTRDIPLPVAIHTDPDDPNGQAFAVKLVCVTPLALGEQLTLDISYRQ